MEVFICVCRGNFCDGLLHISYGTLRSRGYEFLLLSGTFVVDQDADIWLVGSSRFDLVLAAWAPG